MITAQLDEMPRSFLPPRFVPPEDQGILCDLLRQEHYEFGDVILSQGEAADA